MAAPVSQKVPEQRSTVAWSDMPRYTDIHRYYNRLLLPGSSMQLYWAPEIAPPWRFFTRGRASLSAALLTLTLRRAVGSVTATSSQPGRSAWRPGSRASPGKRFRPAAAGRHTSFRLGY